MIEKQIIITNHTGNQMLINVYNSSKTPNYLKHLELLKLLTTLQFLLKTFPKYLSRHLKC